MKIWLDDIRPAPNGYTHCHSVNEAKELITKFHHRKEEYLDEWDFPPIEIWNLSFIIDLDHDLGDYFKDGGDAINLLNWLEETGYGSEGVYIIHSMNPVGRINMLNIIEHNNWRKLK